jgi:hypothetical protein
MPKIRPNKNILDKMRSLYLTAETKIINEIVRKNQQGYVDYAEQAALERIRMTLQGMIDESWEYVPKMVEMQFKTANLVRQGYTNAEALTVPQTMIVEQLIQNLMSEIIESSTTAYNTSKMLYEVARLDNDVYRQTALLATAYNEAAGYGFMHGSETLEQMLNNKGITSFTDKAGRHWSLTDYCTMTSRTTARQAQVAAALTRDDHDLYQIVKIGSTCPLCAVYEGRVYSKSGTDPHYPPLAAAFGKIDPAGSDDLSNTFLNIHPNCLVPGGSVLGEGIMAESRRLYSGEVITLKTSSGNEITVTPNHPILTDRGFIEAKRLIEGDKIIEASSRYASLFGEAPNDINVPTVVDEKLCCADIGPVKQQDAVRLRAVPASTARFLVVRLQASRHVEVRHEAHVRLVDAHAERIRRHHDCRVIVHERLLMRCAHRRSKPCMVARGRHAPLGQCSRQVVNLFARRAVHDTALSFVLSHELLDARRFLLCRKLLNRKAQVRPIETRHQTIGVA